MPVPRTLRGSRPYIPLTLVSQPGIGVKVEHDKAGSSFVLYSSNNYTVRCQTSPPYCRPPGADLNTKDPFDELKYPLQNGIKVEVPSEFLLLRVERLFLHSFDPEGVVPRLEYSDIGFVVDAVVHFMGEGGCCGGQGLFKDKVGEVGNQGNLGCSKQPTTLPRVHPLP